MEEDAEVFAAHRELIRDLEYGGSQRVMQEETQSMEPVVQEPAGEVEPPAEAPEPDPAPEEVLESPPVSMQLEENPPAPAAVPEDEEPLEEDHEEPHDAELAAMLNSSFDMPMEGSIIDGTVLSITNEDVMVAVGGKSEAVLPLSEFKGESPETPLQLGQVYQLVYKGTRGGHPVLSRLEARRIVGEMLILEAYQSGHPINVRATRRTKGGLKVESEGLPGFMPFSHSGVRRGQEAELEGLVGQTFQAMVVEPPSDKNMVVSRRLFLDKKAEAHRNEALSRIEVGKPTLGKVKHLTQFGAFVDLGGIDGLLHVKDMSWGHVAKPEDVVRIGQELEVMVLSIEGEKVALGLKQKSADPWDSFEARYPAGSRCTGTVTSLAQYGAFVELEPGIEGLVHISELSWTKRVRHPSEVLKEGDQVQVVVLGFDKAKKKVSLGYKQTSEDPWQRITRDHPEGSNVTGKVVSLTGYGAFVTLGEGVDGLIHISDLTYGKKINHPSDVLKEGDIVEARVLKIDRTNRKISLGLKQARPDPWFTAGDRYHEGDVVEATINRLADFGAFAEIEPGLDGLIHISEICTRRISHPSEAISVGQQIKATITRLDVDKKKVGLSIRAFEEMGDTREVRPMRESEPETLSDFGQLLNSALGKDRGKRREP